MSLRFNSSLFTKYIHTRIDCNLNIGNVAGIVLRDVPSATLVMICSNCNQEERYPFSILSPNLKPMYEGDLKRLEESINLYLKAYKRCCGSCQRKNSVTVELGQHLVIDIEALQHIISENKNTKENCREFTLSEIPITINVLGNQFTLTGAIEYVAIIPTAHYRPYVRKSHGSWELHDGISKKSKPRRVALKELTKLKKIHLLFFVKKLKT